MSTPDPSKPTPGPTEPSPQPEAPPEPTTPGRATNVWGAVADFRDLAIIIAAFGTLSGLIIFLAGEYTVAQNDFTAFGIVAPLIGSIAGAAFGVSVGARAGSAAGEGAVRATQDQAEKRQNQDNAQVVDTLRDVDQLEQELDKVLNQVQKLPSPTGRKVFLAGGDQIEALRQAPVEISGDDVERARTQLARVRGRLEGLRR